jgi:fumarate reductase subunit D
MGNLKSNLVLTKTTVMYCASCTQILILYNIFFLLFCTVHQTGSGLHRLYLDELCRDEQIVGAYATPGTLT